jgi:hypothetical protein
MYKRKKYDSDSDEEKEEKEIKEETFVNSIYLSGPNKMLKMYNKNSNQTIYLFGEYHGYENECEENKNNMTFNMVEYFSTIFERAKQKIDFYLEAPLVFLLSEKRQKDYYEAKTNIINFYGYKKVGTLVNLRDSFKNCFNPGTRHSCIYKNIRFHYTDLRPLYVLENIGREITFIKTDEEWNKFKNLYSDEIKEMSLVKNCETYFLYLYNKIKNNNSIRKQLQKSGISSELFTKLTIKSCEKFDNYKYVMKFYEILVSDLLPRKYLEIHPNKDYIDIEQDLSDIIQNQLSIIHDIYTVLRMIKKMDGVYQKNIIFYGGLAHYYTIKEMLLELEFSIINEISSNERKRCLKIERKDSINFENNNNFNINKISNIQQLKEIRSKELDFSEIDKEFDELSDSE